ncbi:MAG: pyruvate ferredoxin oxidoreductase, partial [Desulfurococcaceae archaeon]
MGLKLALTGNHAIAYAVKLADPDVIAAYPITPQTPIVEKLAEMIEQGELRAKMIRVESEHSALAACFGAAVAGARTFTATSSQGLLYMHEFVHWVSRARIPVVMAIVSRTINTPWNIWPDHSDFVDQRDAGWAMSYAMDSQEAFDLTLQAFKISEDPRVYLPVMIGIEGFIIGHTAMPVEIPDEKQVKEWLGERRQPYVIDGSEPLGLGGLTFPK